MKKVAVVETINPCYLELITKLKIVSKVSSLNCSASKLVLSKELHSTSLKRTFNFYIFITSFNRSSLSYNLNIFIVI